MSQSVTAAPFAPSGEQHAIAAGRNRVIVVEVGGGFRSVVLDGREVLDGYPVDDMASSGRGQVLMPWPNRLRDGRYTFDGHDYQVPLNEPELNNAIHGLVRWVAWSAVERGPDRVVMEHVLRPSPGYPFTLRLRIHYVVDAAGLTVSTEVTNVGSAACPFGAGAHPWLSVGTPIIDTATLQIPAAVAIWSDERSLPSRSGPVDGTELDYRVARAVGATRIDNGFTELERDASGIARATLASPSGGGVAVWVDRSYPYLMLSTGDVLPDVARRSIAIEPMTCPPNAFQTTEALIRLEPGAIFTGSWGITTI
jgi:aldose 1-epimerase